MLIMAERTRVIEVVPYDAEWKEQPIAIKKRKEKGINRVKSLH